MSDTHGSPELDKDAAKLEALGADPGPTFADLQAPQQSTPRVLNKHRDARTDGALYVGRPSQWGNPFQFGRDGTRADVVAKYRAMICTDPRMQEQARRELRGRDLICFCAPLACHADVLLEVANAE